MEYPEHRISKPVTGREAKELVEVVRSGRCMTNDAAKATVARILERRRRKRVGDL